MVRGPSFHLSRFPTVRDTLGKQEDLLGFPTRFYKEKEYNCNRHDSTLVRVTFRIPKYVIKEFQNIPNPITLSFLRLNISEVVTHQLLNSNVLSDRKQE